MNNKKGVSEIVSYVILIVIAISIGVLVYSFLKLYVGPGTVPESCEEEITIVIKNYSCNLASKSLRLDIFNKGYFKVDAVFVRAGNETKQVRRQLNNKDEILNSSLFPGNNVTKVYIIGPGTPVNQPGNYVIEIQPAVKRSRGFALCEKSIITEAISC